MENFDNFDDLVKRKLDGMEFPFEQANWEKASEMIEANRPAKRTNGALLIAASIIGSAIIISSAYIYVNTRNTSDTKELAQNTTSVESGDLSNKSFTTEQISKTNTGSQTTELTKTNAQLTTVSKTNENTYSATQNSNTYSSKNTVERNSTNNSTNRTNSIESGSIENKTSTSDAMIGKEENAKFKNTNTNAPSSSQNNTSENTATANTTKDQSSLNTVKADIDATDNKETIIKTELPAVTATTQITTLQPDTAKGAISQNDYVKTKHHEMTLEAGAVNSFGWMVNNTRNGNSINPFGGVNYIYHFNPKSAFLIGAQYNSLSNLTESNVSYSVTSYDFGVNNDVTTYKIVGLHFLVAPVKYVHTINNLNSISLGMNLTYLLNTKNRIENYKAIESNVITTESHMDKGYGHGVTTNYNAQLALSYNHKFSKNIAMNVELNRSMRNIFNEYSFFSAKCSGNKPYALKLSLTYSLFTK